MLLLEGLIIFLLQRKPQAVKSDYLPEGFETHCDNRQLLQNECRRE